MTVDRVAGLALGLIGLVAVVESRAFPLGSLHRPGPAFTPMLLALLLILCGAAVFAMGAGGRRLAEVGWHEWRHGGTGTGPLAVSRAPRPWLAGLGLAGVAFALGLGLFLRDRTDAALPFWDAGTTSFSLVAQWMTTRKWIENWAAWIAVDVVYVGMYLSQRLYATAGLYAVFLVLALAGLREWGRSLSAEVEAA